MPRNFIQPPDPNNPLAEPTINRRLWALYLWRGYTRQTFADAMNVDYVVVANWDRGKHVISLPQLAQAVKLLACTIDDVVFGLERVVPPLARAAGGTATVPDLDQRAAIMRGLDLAKATADARSAFAEHAESTQGRYQLFTVEYVTTFAVAYDEALRDGTTPDAARARAYTRAVNARASTAAVSDVAKPVKQKRVPKSRRRLPTSAPVATRSKL
jgi:hypothetical protein